MLYSIPLYKDTQLTFLLFCYEHLGCFQCESVKKNATVNMYFGGRLYSFLLRTDIGIELLGQEVGRRGGIFRRYCQLSMQLKYIPPSKV